MSKLIGTLRILKPNEYIGYKWYSSVNTIGGRETHLRDIAIYGEKPIFSDSAYICGFSSKTSTYYEVFLGVREMGRAEVYKPDSDYTYYTWGDKEVSRKQFFLNKKKLFEKYNNKKHSLSKKDMEEIKAVKRDPLVLSH